MSRNSSTRAVFKLPLGLLKNLQKQYIEPYLTLSEISSLRITCKTLAMPPRSNLIQQHLNNIFETLCVHPSVEAPTELIHLFQRNLSILLITNDKTNPVNPNTLFALCNIISQESRHQDQRFSKENYEIAYTVATLAHQKLIENTLPLTESGYLKLMLFFCGISLSGVSFYQFLKNRPFFKAFALASAFLLSFGILLYSQWNEICRHRVSLRNTAKILEAIALKRPANAMILVSEMIATDIYSLASLNDFSQYMALYFRRPCTTTTFLHEKDLQTTPTQTRQASQAHKLLYTQVIRDHSFHSETYSQLISHSALPRIKLSCIFDNNTTPDLALMAWKIYETESQDLANLIIGRQILDLCFTVITTGTILFEFDASLASSLVIMSILFLMEHHFSLRSEMRIHKPIEQIGRTAWPITDRIPPRIYTTLQPLLCQAVPAHQIHWPHALFLRWPLRSTLLGLMITPQILFERCIKLVSRCTCRRQNKRSAIVFSSGSKGVSTHVYDAPDSP